MHGWRNYSNQAFAEILDTAEAFHMTVNYHTLPDEQAEMDKMAAAHPNVTFIAAHPGSVKITKNICNPRMYVQAVLQEKLTENQMELIFHKNAQRILGITL